VHYLVAASTVTPEDALATRRPGPAVLVVSAQRMDHQLLDSLRQMQVGHPRIEAASRYAPTAVPLLDAEGLPAGRLAWEPEHPSLQVLKEAAPAVAIGLLAVGAVMAALGLQILRVARGMGAHERALTTAMRDLEEARDRAESANLAKSRFLANMSHEIRTPLNGVLGMTQVLAKSDLAAADQDKVQVIRTSGEALLGLLNDLLDLSKIEAGRMELDIQSFDIEETVQAATRSFGVLAAQKDVRFLVDVEPAARGVWRGDGSRIRQVLANLTSNAVKFTSAGEVRVGVRRTEDGLACTVSDSGVGIAADRLERLFQRFSQVDPSTTRKYGGTGLGLAISRELVELMGGGIAVSSVEGRGSAFSFTLPLEWLAPAAERLAEPAAESSLPSLRVLAAEDNATNQLLLTAILGPLGVDLKLTADGREAVDAFAHEPFDLVLLDVQMPVMNGVDAAVAMRELEAARGQPPTPILAVSANVMRHQIEEYLAAGMNGFVAKPIDMPALIGAMERALAGTATDADAAAA
jgi:signal transduction histidine kinase